MTDHNPLHADFYADAAIQARVRIVENVRLARDTYRVRFDCPEIAGRIVPGQFLMLRLAGCNDPLLGRPLALYNTVHDSTGHPVAVDVVYQTIGKMTSRLSRCTAGDELDVWSPLGNGFPAITTEHLVMVAGGIGQTPFLALGQQYLGGRTFGIPPRRVIPVKRVTMCYGVRSAGFLAGIDDFKTAEIDTRVSSDDGSVGYHGVVTDLLASVLNESTGAERLVVCCGPQPMMQAVSNLCKQHDTQCLASLETPMACGIGICFSCVARIRQPDGDWDYKRTCVEGPIFDAAKIEW